MPRIYKVDLYRGSIMQIRHPNTSRPSQPQHTPSAAASTRPVTAKLLLSRLSFWTCQDEISSRVRVHSISLESASRVHKIYKYKSQLYCYNTQLKTLHVIGDDDFTVSTSRRCWLFLVCERDFTCHFHGHKHGVPLSTRDKCSGHDVSLPLLRRVLDLLLKALAVCLPVLPFRLVRANPHRSDTLTLSNALHLLSTRFLLLSTAFYRFQQQRKQQQHTALRSKCFPRSETGSAGLLTARGS